MTYETYIRELSAQADDVPAAFKALADAIQEVTNSGKTSEEALRFLPNLAALSEARAEEPIRLDQIQALTFMVMQAARASGCIEEGRRVVRALEALEYSLTNA